MWLHIGEKTSIAIIVIILDVIASLAPTPEAPGGSGGGDGQVRRPPPQTGHLYLHSC